MTRAMVTLRRPRALALERLARLGTGSLLLVVPVVGSQAAPPAADVGVVTAGQARASQGTPAGRLPLASPLRKPEIRSSLPKARTSLAGLRLSMQGFRVEGNVRVSEDGLQQAMAPWLDRELSFPEFEKAVHAVADYLRHNGHPKVQVRISRTMMKEGQMAVAIEGLTPRSADYADVPVVEPLIHVKRFEVTGVTRLSPDELKAILEPWEGKELSIADMQKPAEAIAGAIRAKGYPLAQAFLPPQRVDGGTLEIRCRRA